MKFIASEDQIKGIIVSVVNNSKPVGMGFIGIKITKKDEK